MKHVLVVEDMAVVREPIAAVLRAIGYQTVTAADGAEALRQVRNGAVGLILMDVKMPGMDGLSVLQSLRSDPQTARIPEARLQHGAQLRPEPAPEPRRHEPEQETVDEGRPGNAHVDPWLALTLFPTRCARPRPETPDGAFPRGPRAARGR